VDEDPTVPLRERKRLRTRAQIESAALALFVERGFEHTTVAQIAAAADVGERTFHEHFAAKEDVVLGDIEREMASLAEVLHHRAEGQSVLALFGELGDRRIALFRDHSEQVLARRTVEQHNPDVHARAVAARERAERALLTPAFALDLALAEDDHRVTLLVAAFTGISVVLDGLFAASPDDASARAVLDAALTALTAAAKTLGPMSDV